MLAWGVVTDVDDSHNDLMSSFEYWRKKEILNIFISSEKNFLDY